MTHFIHRCTECGKVVRQWFSTDGIEAVPDATVPEPIKCVCESNRVGLVEVNGISRYSFHISGTYTRIRVKHD